jgi:hypothetical protein
MQTCNGIMKSFILLAILLNVSPAAAQSPVITFLHVDELSRTLSVQGLGFGTGTGSVSVDGQVQPISTWSDTLVECSISDTGIGSAGPVILTTSSNKPSSGHLLSVSKFSLRDEQTNSYPNSLNSVAMWHIVLRVDLLDSIPSVGESLRTARISSAAYAYSSSNGEIFRNSSANGSAVGSKPDSGGAWLVATFQRYAISSLQIDSLNIYGAIGTVTQPAKNFQGDSTWKEALFFYPEIQLLPIMLNSRYTVVDTSYMMYDSHAPSNEFFTCSSDSSYFLPAPLSVAPVFADGGTRPSLFPNPAHTTLNVSFDGPRSEIRVYDLLGRLRLSQNALSGVTKLDVNGLESGTYMIQVNGYHESFLVER